MGAVGTAECHAVERRHVQDVDVASPIHQHLVDPLGLEQWSHHDRVASWLRHAIGVVRAVESDQSLRPLEVRWCRGLGVVDPAPDQLFLAS
jgi:hypothetical protein